MARILAVDDSRSIREMVVLTLESAGHDVTEASDGLQALDIARTAEFDAVVTDLDMPGMDGLTLVGELRGLPQFRLTPIVMLTTETSPEKKQIARERGATGWLVKPLDPEELLEILAKVLD